MDTVTIDTGLVAIPWEDTDAMTDVWATFWSRLVEMNFPEEDLTPDHPGVELVANLWAAGNVMIVLPEDEYKRIVRAYAEPDPEDGAEDDEIDRQTEEFYERSE